MTYHILYRSHRLWLVDVPEKPKYPMCKDFIPAKVFNPCQIDSPVPCYCRDYTEACALALKEAVEIAEENVQMITHYLTGIGEKSNPQVDRHGLQEGQVCVFTWDGSVEIEYQVLLYGESETDRVWKKVRPGATYSKNVTENPELWRKVARFVSGEGYPKLTPEQAAERQRGSDLCRGKEEPVTISIDFKPKLEFVDGEFQIWINGEQWVVKSHSPEPEGESQENMWDEIFNFLIVHKDDQELLKSKWFLTRRVEKEKE